MRIICNDCNKSFNFTEIPKFCPYCSGSSLERNNKKQKERALNLIKEYNEITIKMESFIDVYIASSKRIKEIRHELATYKTRGIITADELPYEKNENLMSFIKRRIQEKEKEI
jgi:hypothetical protein